MISRLLYAFPMLVFGVLAVVAVMGWNGLPPDPLGAFWFGLWALLSGAAAWIGRLYRHGGIG